MIREEELAHFFTDKIWMNEGSGWISREEPLETDLILAKDLSYNTKYDLTTSGRSGGRKKF